MRCVTILANLLITALAVAADSSVPSPAQLAIIDAHLKQIGVLGDIPREFIQMRAVPNPGEGQIALAVLYTHESPSGPGNTWDQRLAVFVKHGEGLSEPIDIIAGGALRRQLLLRSAAPKRIVLDVKNYAPQDFACCPTVPGVATFTLSNGALSETTSPNPSVERP